MSDYVNGIFIEEKDGKYGKYLSISISEKGLEELGKLPKSEKGNINITANRQKNNNNKFSCKPYVSVSKSSSTQNRESVSEGSKEGYTQFGEPVSSNDSSDLPF